MWDKNICMTNFTMVVVSLAWFIFLLHKLLEKFVWIIVWFSQKFLCFCCHTTNFWFWLEYMFQLARMHVQLARMHVQLARIHVFQLANMHVQFGQDTCFSWLGYMFFLCTFMDFWLHRFYSFYCVHLQTTSSSQ